MIDELRLVQKGVGRNAVLEWQRRLVGEWQPVHHWRAWGTAPPYNDKWNPAPPEGTVDPCGDCGLAKAQHLNDIPPVLA